eukprot:6154375-Amphidinium_carterae.1
MTSRDLGTVLQWVNSKAFTYFNLQSLKKQGQREADKTMLCQLIEVISNVPGWELFGGNFKN